MNPTPSDLVFLSYLLLAAVCGCLIAVCALLRMLRHNLDLMDRVLTTMIRLIDKLDAANQDNEA